MFYLPSKAEAGPETLKLAAIRGALNFQRNKVGDNGISAEEYYMKKYFIKIYKQLFFPSLGGKKWRRWWWGETEGDILQLIAVASGHFPRGWVLTAKLARHQKRGLRAYLRLIIKFQTSIKGRKYNFFSGVDS